MVFKCWVREWMGDSYHGGIWKRGDRKTVERGRGQRTLAAQTAQETGQAQGMRTTLVERVIKGHEITLCYFHAAKTKTQTNKRQ